MSVDEVHAVFTDYGQFGWSLSSAQLPGLVAGAATMAELSRDLFDLAVGAGMSPAGSVYEYEQHVIEVEDRLFAVRVKGDYTARERAATASHVMGHLHSEEGLRAYTTQDAMGDSIIIACVPSDRIGDVTASLEVGQPATIAVRLKDQTTYTGIVRGGDHPDHGLRLSDVGLSNESTVEELFDQLSERLGVDEGVIEHELVHA